jgi:serine/threonine protein kinase
MQRRRLGNYQILSLLGAGGMGEVYRARDTKLHRDVALKILPEAVAQDADRLERFGREARTLASLNHAHIVTVFSIEEDNDVPTSRLAAVGTGTSISPGPAGISSAGSRKPVARSTAIRCRRTSR